VKKFSFSGEHRKEDTSLCFPPKLIYGGTMSILFNQPQPAASKKGFWERCEEMQRKMHEKDASTPLDYCTQKWIRKNKASPKEDDKASAAFQRCMDSVYAHKQLSEFLRRY